MDEQLKRLLELKSTTQNLDTVERKHLVTYYQILERIATLSGRSIFQCRIPHEDMQIDHLTEFNEHDLGEIVSQIPSVRSVTNQVFQKYLQRAITLAQEISQTPR